MSKKYRRLYREDGVHIINFTDGALARRYMRVVDRAGHCYRMEAYPDHGEWHFKWWRR